ncbi:MAG: hypothetical protein A2Y45_01545 [Tenericutes bacterium GWC2_34_14]|nr:MAG: hypothetical protein A2Z84_01915 [Tenericutes bacterium GWA2_35_7]OHE28222.1 MAG: hypothetical protein A2Y45_01545 [Tenericutes bacterium GWC2_34_14]OHE33152.1 MAG: hypothetical protein A2012_00535 [Tenericutes bacterium GWE2_34_108]OHE36272.1 MAG: hypothetical protein A2Y46_07525 [Tenericutes bacterium GWF1_35_14]OHE38686.1 MAG: hypothetical protein A2Y44_04705 [Tenericutes bacterium GWF2_35_184]OHE44815.1 MAG: hypothetical protein A2221_01190 [Tenericutes bacterium RIFOXYA2_FULL_36_3
MNEKQKTDLYKINEVAEYLRVSRRTVYTYIKQGKLQGFQIGVEWRVTKDNLEKFMEKLIKGDFKK